MRLPSDARVIPAATGETNVHVHLGVIYARRPGRDLHLQIVQPSGDAVILGEDEAFSGRFPCLVFVQGSGWGPQELGASLSFMCRLAERGYVVAIVEYRPSAEAVFPAQVEDGRDAVHWLRLHADEYDIDPDAIVVSGDSSGGHTALLMQVTDGLTALGLPEARPLGAIGTIAFQAPTDIAAKANEDNVRGLFGGRPPTDAEAAGADPVTYLTPQRPLAPTLIVHGTADDVVPVEHSLRLHRALHDAGQPSELVIVDGAAHGFWPSFYTDELLDIVTEFLERCTA